jgi:hypothetical protein
MGVHMRDKKLPRSVFVKFERNGHFGKLGICRRLILNWIL